MIEFKKNVKELLPYDRKQYIEFSENEFNSSIKWYGVWIQLHGIYYPSICCYGDRSHRICSYLQVLNYRKYAYNAWQTDFPGNWHILGGEVPRGESNSTPRHVSRRLCDYQ